MVRRKPKTVVCSYKLPEDLDEKVRVSAARRDVWPATVVTEALNEYFDARRRKEQSPEPAVTAS